MRRTLKLLLVLTLGLALRRGGGDGPRRPGNGDGPPPPQQSPSGKINTSQGTESASRAVQTEAEQGRAQEGATDGDTSDPDGGTGPRPSEAVAFDPKKINKKFKHADDFGVEGKNNPENREKFQKALEKHIDAPGTQRIEGTYRGDPVVHYIDPATGRNVMTDRNGNFLSAWKLNDAQRENVTTSRCDEHTGQGVERSRTSGLGGGCEVERAF